MKTLLKSSLVIFLLLMVSCKKDDVAPNGNSVMLNNETFDVVVASMAGVSIGDDGHTGITLSGGTSQVVNSLTIDVESFTQETIEGTYSYPATSEDKLMDSWLTNYSVFEGETTLSSNLESGSVNIKNNGGNNYTVSMDLTMIDGAIFSGSYTGSFQVMFYNN